MPEIINADKTQTTLSALITLGIASFLALTQTKDTSLSLPLPGENRKRERERERDCLC